MNEKEGEMRLRFFFTQNAVLRYAARLKRCSLSRSPYRNLSLKEARELWLLGKILVRRDLWPFIPPIELWKSESPDFLLKAAQLTVGVEITELIYPETAKGRSFAEEAGMKVSFPVSPDDVVIKDTKSVYLERLRGIGSGPFLGNRPEKLLSDKFSEQVQHKNRMRSSYSGAGVYWLLIYNNTHFPLSKKTLIKSGYWDNLLAVAEQATAYQNILLFLGGRIHRMKRPSVA